MIKESKDAIFVRDQIAHYLGLAAKTLQRGSAGRWAAMLKRVGNGLRDARLWQRNHIWGAATCALIIAALGASVIAAPRPRFVWNASGSAPIGLWHVAPGSPVARGDMVIARLAEPWRSLAARRRYLPANIPIIKRVAPQSGDRICATNSKIFVNGSNVATRLKLDGAGRSMTGMI